jgi:monooxygenase
MAQRPHLIIGSGIAGLTLARTLQRKNVPFKIFEKATKQAHQGYGITLRSWAYDPFLKHLSINPRKFQDTVATDALAGGHGAIGTSMYDMYTGEPLIQGLASPAGRPGGDFFRASRERLREFLMEGIDVKFGHTLVDLKYERDHVVARFDGGKEEEGSLVIGADGVHSAVRKALIPDITLTLDSTNVYIGERTMTRKDFDDTIGKYFEATNVYAGIGDDTIVALTISNKGPESVSLAWIYMGRAGPNSKPPMASPGHVSVLAKIVEDIKNLENLAPPFSDILDTGLVEKDNKYRWSIRSLRIPAAKFNDLAASRAALIGDAAHAMPIFAGEGGNHGMQDGFELGQALAARRDDDAVKDLRSFLDSAAPRWENAVERSEQRAEGLMKPIETWRAAAKKQSKET